MKTRTISTKELREDFAKVKSAMAAGQSLLLMYRSKPLAEIKPLPNRNLPPREFSTREINDWIQDDQITSAQKQAIESIIDRLS